MMFPVEPGRPLPDTQVASHWNEVSLKRCTPFSVANKMLPSYSTISATVETLSQKPMLVPFGAYTSTPVSPQLTHECPVDELKYETISMEPDELMVVFHT